MTQRLWHRPSRTPEPETIQASVVDASPTEYPTGLRSHVLFGSIILAGLLIALNASMIGTATPAITTEFHSIADVGWYGSAFLITKCVGDYRISTCSSFRTSSADQSAQLLAHASDWQVLYALPDEDDLYSLYRNLRARNSHLRHCSLLVDVDHRPSHSRNR
jgi:hypothetical protein